VSVLPWLSAAAAAILSGRSFYLVCVRCPFRKTCSAKRELDEAEVEDHEGIIGEFVDPTFAEHP